MAAASVLEHQNLGGQKWVVYGASGFVGSAVCERAEMQGALVERLRAPRLASACPSVPEACLAEARDSEVLDELAHQLESADVVVNAAGLATPDANMSHELVGANAILPAVIALASNRGGVRRFVHLSSAAVQGARPKLDETPDRSPLSPYAASKALGEEALEILQNQEFDSPSTEITVIRATSVQGPKRSTSSSLVRIAKSPISSVASPGNQRSVVSSLEGLASFVTNLGGQLEIDLPPILLQPWEGATVINVLEIAGGRAPIVLPGFVCKACLRLTYLAGRVHPKFIGLGRRMEMMWFGQDQADGWAIANGKVANHGVGVSRGLRAALATGRS